MTDTVFPDRLSQLRTRWEADPSSRIFLQLAEEYRHLGRVREALDVLDRGLKEHPGYLSALVAKGRCHLELGEGEAARAVLERVVKQDATQMVANKLLVRAYLETGEPDKARERLDLYSLLNDSDPEIEELRRRIRLLDRPAQPQATPQAAATSGTPSGAPGGPSAMAADDPFSFEPAPPPRRPEPAADIFDLGGPPAPHHEVEDVFALEEPAPAAEPPAAAPIAPEPAPVLADEAAAEEETDGDLFPGLASRDMRRRYLERLGAEGLFEPVVAPEPAPPRPPLEEPSWLEEAAALAPPPAAAPASPPAPFELSPTPPAAPEEDLWSEEPTEVWAAEAPATTVEAVEEPLPDLLPPLEEEPAWSEPAAELLPAIGEPWAAEAAPEALPAVEEPAAPEPAPTPAGPVATATLGELYLRQGHYHEAERIFREVLEREPDNAAARDSLQRLAEIEPRRKAPALDAQQLLRDYLPGPEDAGRPGVRARKVHVLNRYLERLRGNRPHVS